jgi:hypothetical protein
MDPESVAELTEPMEPEESEASELPRAVVEMPVPDPEPTGHPDVDAALDRLRELADRPTGAHPELYDDVHRRLQDALAEIDQQGARE